MEFFGPDSALEVLKGATIILPAVAYANVGELAVDVLVASLQSLELGILEDENVLPAVGNDAYDLSRPGTLATAMQLYHLQGTQIVILQQRAPAMTGRQAQFAQNMVSWLQSQGAKELLVLSGLDAQLMRDVQIEGPRIRYVTSSASASSDAEAAEAACQSAGLTPLEADVLGEERSLHGALPPWPLLAEADTCGLPTTLLAGFVSEGDNTPDGLALAAHCLRLLARMHPEAQHPALQAGTAAAATESVAAGATAAGLRLPCSWAAVYGRSFPREIF